MRSSDQMSAVMEVAHEQHGQNYIPIRGNGIREYELYFEVAVERALCSHQPCGAKGGLACCVGGGVGCEGCSHGGGLDLHTARLRRLAKEVERIL